MRKLIAGAWIVGSVASLFLLAAFLFGCCALPFHRVLHRALPICGYVTGILSGANHEQHDATPASNKRGATIAKGVPTKTVICDRRMSRPLSVFHVAHNAPALQNIRTLGALRVDDDIGLHALFSIYLI